MIIFADGIMSFGLEFSCEVSYPIPPNNSSGVVLSYSHVLSTLLLVTASYIVKDPNNRIYSETENKKGSFIMWGIFLIGFVLALIFALLAKEDLRKTQIDIQEKPIIKENH